MNNNTAQDETEERHNRKDALARRALHLAETNINAAMNFMVECFAWKFLTNSQNFLATFNYVHRQHQQDIARMIRNHHEYTWPQSFPDCTPALRTVVNHWIKHDFYCKSRAKCLIIIGPTGTGKTTFAKSLSGPYNYFNGVWRNDDWNSSARYSIFDNVHWNDFEEKGYPSKKGMFTQDGLLNVIDATRKIKQINVKQPAIVLLHPGQSEGSLTAEPITSDDRHEADFWNARATVYRMGPDEYFYKEPDRIENDEDQMLNSSTIASSSEDIDETN